MFAADSTVTVNRYEEYPWYNPFKWGSGAQRVSLGINASMTTTGHTPQGMLIWNATENGAQIPIDNPFAPPFAQLANLTK